MESETVELTIEEIEDQFIILASLIMKSDPRAGETIQELLEAAKELAWGADESEVKH